MDKMVLESSREGVDLWLRNVVARAISQSDSITTDRAELWALLDSLPAAILISTDRACTRIVGNRAAQEMLKVPHGANLSQSAPANELPPFQVYKNGCLVPPTELPMQKAAELGERVSQSECEIRFNDEQSIFIAGHSIPIYGKSNEICGSIGAFIDITESNKKIEIADVISGEMAHRAKNEVSMILAIARMTMSKHVEAQIFDTFEKRLLNIARLNAAAPTDNLTGVNFRQVIENSIIPIVGSESSRVSITGENLPIDFIAGRNFGMILHELTTNACKYGALANSGGIITINWNLHEAEGTGRIDFRWSETGGPPVAAPRKAGFGSKLISTLMRGIPHSSFEIKYPPSGLQANISFLTPEPSGTNKNFV